MARFRRSVVLRPLARRTVEEYLALGFDVAESLTSEHRTAADGALTDRDGRPVAALRLRSGAHLRPGAVYELPEPDAETRPASDGEALDPVRELTLLAWDRRGDTGLRLALGEERVLLVTTELWLRAAGRPARLECSGKVLPGSGQRWSGLRRLAWSGRLDLDRWYAAAGRRVRPGGGRAPLVGRLDHRWARGTFQVTPRPAGDGRWRLVLRCDLRGRGPLRPLAAVALLLARGRINRAVDAQLPEVAREWEQLISRAPIGDREALRRQIVDELCAPAPDLGAAREAGPSRETGAPSRTHRPREARPD